MATKEQRLNALSASSVEERTHTLPIQHMAAEIADGEWTLPVILEEAGGFKKVLVKRHVVNVPSFSKEDEMPVVAEISYGLTGRISPCGRHRIIDLSRP